MPIQPYVVRFEGRVILTAHEVSGLGSSVESVEYRDSDGPFVRKVPGLRGSSTTVLKRCVGRDPETMGWLTSLAHGGGGGDVRRDLVIELLNESAEVVATWRVPRAWPAKVQAPELKADANEVAIETIELVHEGIEVVDPPPPPKPLPWWSRWLRRRRRPPL